MNEEISRNRSPNYPRMTLADALGHTSALYKKANRSPLKADVAANALGYAGLTGSSLTLLGALNQYGLIERAKGEVRISELALKILHPVDQASKDAAMREAALSPKVFLEMFEKWKNMDGDVMANNLIHQEFVPEAAKRCVSVYKENYALAKLGETASEVSLPPQSGVAKVELTETNKSTPPSSVGKVEIPNRPAAKTNVLASYKIPIGLCEAEITFTGEQLEPQDFDALAEYVELFKKQYERKLKASQAAEAARRSDETEEDLSFLDEAFGKKK